ncbi:histidine phosphatase family protein [Shouchella lehensis]|uniref:Histidine phosphatase family protein n=1 Tax=Shouchella lehensis TaxID=300825 RepID=A0A4Y7WSP5_9BACI|nr:histidine phosphatase family protein [Shouchella lehensis]MBG9783739.1 hypothetical protein [Shouchella lehensis]TES51304.1 histidine phosphatase family protein [Shouchella lehensis]
MHTIYLVRHAHSSYTPDEWGRPLTENGLEDAERVAEYFDTVHVDRFISSPYKRAIQTIETAAKRKKLPIKIEEAFKERVLAATSMPHFDSAIKAVWEDETFAHLGGESNKTARRRAVNGLWRILDQGNDSESIVISTHGNILALLLGYFHSRYDFTFWQQLEMPDVYQMLIEKQTMLSCTNVWEKK